jgi:polyisoprenoid-binding protein YceI
MKNRILTLWVLTAMTFVGCKNEKNAADAAADAATISQEAVTYTVDATASMVEWVGSKPAGKHNGTISVSGGEVMVKEGVIEGGNFTLDMNSITVLDLAAGEGKEDLEGHLKGLGKEEDADHFFNTKKFPEGTFEITSSISSANPISSIRSASSRTRISIFPNRI